MSKFNIKVLALLNERSPKGFTEGDILATAKADFGASLGTARRALRTFKRKKFIYPYVAKSETKIYRVSKYGKERINKYKLSSLFEQHLRNTTCLRLRKKTKLKDEMNHAQIRIPKYPNSVLWKNILATLFYSPNNIVTMEDFKAVLGKGFFIDGQQCIIRQPLLIQGMLNSMQKDKMIVLENGSISLGEKGYKLVARICGQNFPIKSTAFFEEMREFLCYIPNNCRNNIRKAKKNFHALLMSMLAYIISARAIFMLKPTCLFFEE